MKIVYILCMNMDLNIRQTLSVVILFTFLVSVLGPLPASAGDLILPAPGTRVALSPAFNPPVLKGIKVHPDNPFRFDFILDKGTDANSAVRPIFGQELGSVPNLKDEANKLIKYFLASLTVPEKDLWVNLSPYEKDRIVPQSFGLTEMGRDLLAQDYLLKQITASLIYPEDEFGKKFWKRVYEEAAKKFGTTNIPVNTFNKVWIVPEKAVVYENAQAGTAYVVESKLKVMLEQDYVALSKNNESATSRGFSREISTTVDLSASLRDDAQKLGTDIVRQIVIPQLTKEINENKNFAQLRQVYNSLILATWYKKKIKDSILNKVYADRNKIKGTDYTNSVINQTPTRGHVTEAPASAGDRNVSPSRLPSNPTIEGESTPGKSLSASPDTNDIEGIYQQYLTAFKKGVYNYIKEEQDPLTQQVIPRKYFSGGFNMDMAMLKTTTDAAMINHLPYAMSVQVDIRPDRALSAQDSAMLAQRIRDTRPVNFDGLSVTKQMDVDYFSTLIKSGVRLEKVVDDLEKILREGQLAPTMLDRFVSAAGLLFPEFKEELNTWKSQFSTTLGDTIVLPQGLHQRLEASYAAQKDALRLWVLCLDHWGQVKARKAEQQDHYDFIQKIGSLEHLEDPELKNEVIRATNILCAKFGFDDRTTTEIIESALVVRGRDENKDKKSNVFSDTKFDVSNILKDPNLLFETAVEWAESGLIPNEESSSFYKLALKNILVIHPQDGHEGVVSETGHLIFEFMSRRHGPSDVGVQEMFDALATMALGEIEFEYYATMGPVFFDYLSTMPTEEQRSRDSKWREVSWDNGDRYIGNHRVEILRRRYDIVEEILTNTLGKKKAQDALRKDPYIVTHSLGVNLAEKLVAKAGDDKAKPIKAMRLAGQMLQETDISWISDVELAATKIASLPDPDAAMAGVAYGWEWNQVVIGQWDKDFQSWVESQDASGMDRQDHEILEQILLGDESQLQQLLLDFPQKVNVKAEDMPRPQLNGRTVYLRLQKPFKGINILRIKGARPRYEIDSSVISSHRGEGYVDKIMRVDEQGILFVEDIATLPSFQPDPIELAPQGAMLRSDADLEYQLMQEGSQGKGFETDYPLAVGSWKNRKHPGGPTGFVIAGMRTDDIRIRIPFVLNLNFMLFDVATDEPVATGLKMDKKIYGMMGSSMRAYHDAGYYHRYPHNKNWGVEISNGHPRVILRDLDTTFTRQELRGHDKSRVEASNRFIDVERIMSDLSRQGLELDLFNAYDFIPKVRPLTLAFLEGYFPEIKIGSEEFNALLNSGERMLSPDWKNDLYMGATPRVDLENIPEFRFIWNRLRDLAAKQTRDTDAAMQAKGGIDFNADKVDSAFEVKKDPREKLGTRNEYMSPFFDPAMLKQLQDAQGFMPVIINIQPLTDLRMFLGLQVDPLKKEHFTSI